MRKISVPCHTQDGGEGGLRAYRKDLARNLWNVTEVAASYLDWQTADAAAVLAMNLGGPQTANATTAFRLLCRMSPWLALRMREAAIRLTRPAMRAGYPAWRSARVSVSSAR